MSTSRIFLMPVLLTIYASSVCSETIPAIHKQTYPLATGFLYMGGGFTAAFGETHEEACNQGTAYGYPIIWERPLPIFEYACYTRDLWKY